MIAPRKRHALRHIIASLCRRVMTTAALAVGCAVGLGALLPHARLALLCLAAAGFVAKCVRDAYVCSWPVRISAAGIASRRRDAAGRWQACRIRWHELAGVEKILWDPLGELQRWLLSPRKVQLGLEEIWLTAPCHETPFHVLRRAFTCSSDVLFQARTDGTTLLVPWATLSRQEHHQLRQYLRTLAPGVVRFWLGRADSRTRQAVAEATRARLERLAAAERAELHALEQQSQSRWQQAEEGYSTALTIYRAEGEMERVAICARSLAFCAVLRGRFQQARDLYAEALGLWQALGDRRAQADCYSHLAQLFMHTKGPLGRQAALTDLDQAARLFRAAGLARYEGEMWGNMGVVYQSLASLWLRLPDAAWWQECQAAEHVARLRAGGLEVHEAPRADHDAGQGTGRTWLSCALACHRQALAVLRAGRARRRDRHTLLAEANQLGCIADIYRQQGALTQALQQYADAKRLSDVADVRFSQDLSGWGLSLLQLALDAPQVQTSAPSVALDQAIRLLNAAVTAARQAGDALELVLAHARRAQAFRRIGHGHAARKDLEHAVEILEQVRPTAGSALARAVLLHDHMEVYGDLIEVLVELEACEPGQAWAMKALEYCERAKCRTLVEQYLSVVQSWDVPLPHIHQEPGGQTIQTVMSDIEAGRTEDELEHTAGTGALPRGDQSESPEGWWDRMALPPELTVTGVVGDSLLAQCLAPGTLVLEMFARAPYTIGPEPRDALLVVLPATRGGLGEPVIYRGEAAEELFKAAEALQQHVGSAHDPENVACRAPCPYGTGLQWYTDPRTGERRYTETKVVAFDPVASGAQRLYTALIGAPQVQTMLSAPADSGPISRLLFVPHGSVFTDLPYCALHSGRSFLIEEYEVVICPSLQWQAQSLRTGHGRHPVGSHGLGLASAAHDLQPHATNLLKPLEDALDIAIRYGAASPEQDDQARATLVSPDAAGYRWVTIVAHGDAWPSPRLHFAARKENGSFFPAGDVTLPDVYCDVRLDCDVLTLFVCFAHQQALSVGGEWQSMSAAFLARGARSILAARYALYVDTTAMLLEEVFEAMIAGESAPAALRRAQCACARGEGDYEEFKHPYYWALSLIGGVSHGAGVMAAGETTPGVEESL